MDNETEKNGKRKREVIIQDLRHGRNHEPEVEPEERTSPADAAAETTLADEPSVPPAEPELDLEGPSGHVERSSAKSNAGGDVPPDTTPELTATEAGEEDAASEITQLRQLFGAGVDSYLRGQLGLLLNFALIYLGRSPNPATGLMSPDTDKAKLAIDVIEFIAARIQQNMPEAERREIASVLSELKYAFMQSVASAPPPQEPDDPQN